jgi:hypothetical protein
MHNGVSHGVSTWQSCFGGCRLLNCAAVGMVGLGGRWRGSQVCQAESSAYHICCSMCQVCRQEVYRETTQQCTQTTVSLPHLLPWRVRSVMRVLSAGAAVSSAAPPPGPSPPAATHHPGARCLTHHQTTPPDHQPTHSIEIHTALRYSIEIHTALRYSRRPVTACLESLLFTASCTIPPYQWDVACAGQLYCVPMYRTHCEEGRSL